LQRYKAVILSEVWRVSCAKRSRKPALSEFAAANESNGDLRLLLLRPYFVATISGRINNPEQAT
jgi:hypothetical protein